MGTDTQTKHTLHVSASEHGTRVDRVAASRLAGVSRSLVQQLIADGLLTVNGERVRPSDSVATGDTVSVTLPSTATDDTIKAAAELPLHVIHVDDAIVVVDKPAGQVVHPAAGHADDTLVNALLARFPDLAEAFEGQRPGLVHRLDRDTTGVIVVARTEAVAASLRAQFKDRTVEKTYVTLLRGRVVPPEGVIDAPIGRDPRRRKQMAAIPGGRASLTAYRVIDVAGNYSLVEAEPRTGRTHQIRVHFDAIGYPVAGDTVYGKRDRHIGRLALHAYRLSFDHPSNGKRVTFEAPLPADMAAAIVELGLRWPKP